MIVTQGDSLVNMQKMEKPSAQNTNYRIEKDNTHRKCLERTIFETCNPFDEPAISSMYLINIATGKAATEATEKYPTSVLETGKSARIAFENECNVNKKRFFMPIKKIPVMNFAKSNQKGTKSCKKTSSVESMRDSFIQLLLMIAEKTGVDMDNVVSYPITRYPLAIAYSDGLPIVTKKSQLLNYLEEQVVTSPGHQKFDVSLIDGGLLLYIPF